VIRASQPWTGGGFSPMRLDRAEIRRRLEGFTPWIVNELMDAFEPAALAAITEGEKARKRTKRGRKDRTETTNRDRGEGDDE
jgi:hypothetical protein